MIPVLRHEKVALQFSGGKDSLAIATMLLPWKHRITVYCLTTPNMYPETLASIAWVRERYPTFVEIVSEPYAELPSDLVPADATPFGRIVTGDSKPPIHDRYECCFRTIMEPLALRMAQDEIKLIIRGQKEADPKKGPLKSGMVQADVEYWFPLQAWTDEDVLAYLERKGTPIPAFYKAGLKGGLDCPGCSAWWPERRMAWLEKTHPKLAVAVKNKLTFIASQVQPSLDLLDKEMNGGD